MKCVDKFEEPEHEKNDLDECKNLCELEPACKKFGFSAEEKGGKIACRFPFSREIKCEVGESESSSYYRPPLVELKLDGIIDMSTESSKDACLSECMQYDGSSGCEIVDNKVCYASLGAGIPTSSSSGTPNIEDLYVGTGHDGDAITETDKVHDLSQVSLVGRSCADAKMMKTSSVTASTLTLTSSPSSPLSGCFNIEDEILIWNQANGVHYFRRVASMTSNVITIKGGKIDAVKLGTPVLVQRVPNYSKLTVVSGSTLTHAAYGTNGSGGVLAFRVFTSLVVQDGGNIDMSKKGYVV